MKVFLTWSGTRSHAIASYLRIWLRDVLQHVQPWVSDRDIPAGVMWSAEITTNLQAASAGIICVTPENQMEPWVLFEAGALANRFGTGSKVCVYLIGMSKADLLQGPLSLYQATSADKGDTLRLLHSLNESLGSDRLPDDVLERSFERCWPELERKFREVIADVPRTPVVHRDSDELLRDVLVEIRRIGRQNESVLEAVRPTRESVADDFYGAPTSRAEKAREIAGAAADRLRLAAITAPDLLPIIDRSTLVYGREGVYEISARDAGDYQLLLKNRKTLNDLAKEAGLGFAIHVIKPQRENRGA
jgi:hypothetical protein